MACKAMTPLALCVCLAIGSGILGGMAFVGVGMPLCGSKCVAEETGLRSNVFKLCQYAQCGTKSPSAAYGSKCRNLSLFFSTMLTPDAAILSPGKIMD